MADRRPVQVHLLPALVPDGALRGATAVVIDVLRSATTMVAALDAGCTNIRPCDTVDEARQLAAGLANGGTLLGGEHCNVRIPGFDLGISPFEYTALVCCGKTLVLTTDNGTRALSRAVEAERVLVAGFVNRGAVCEQLRQDLRPVHIVCAGTDGAVTLEDALLAGALVDDLAQKFDVSLNDSARLAWDSFKNRGSCLHSALEMSDGARGLFEHDHARDIEFAAGVDRFHLVPELRRDPLRLEVAGRSLPEESACVPLAKIDMPSSTKGETVTIGKAYSGKRPFMTASAHKPAAVEPSLETRGIRKNWAWFLALGIVQAIAGAAAVSFFFNASLGSGVMLGVLLLAAGGAQLASAVLARGWDGYSLFLSLAFVYGAAGLLTLEQPPVTAGGLAYMLGALLLIVGLYRVAATLTQNLPSPGCILSNGIVALLLGVAMWRWPAPTFGTLGLLVGIELIANGVTWTILSVGVRRSVERLACP